MPDCPAVPKEALSCAQTVLDWMEREHIPVYDEAAKRDGVRHIFYRSSHLTEKAVLTLTASRSPGEKALGILTDMLRERCPDVTGLVLNRNTARGNTVLAGEFDTVWGSEVLTEGLCGLTFTLSPRSFFQVNPPQAERLYEAALGYAGITPGMTALDLYCGTGTIGLCMASAARASSARRSFPPPWKTRGTTQSGIIFRTSANFSAPTRARPPRSLRGAASARR